MATITSPRPHSPSPATTPRVASPTLNDTPTSSVRPSIEISIRSASPQPQHVAPAQRRNRAALRDYYNLKAKPSPTPGSAGGLTRTASIASVASDSTIASTAALTTETGTTSNLTAQLDDPAFDAQPWIDQLLKNSSLKDILKTEAVLVSEIRNLDGERKALVYDNYSKLIKAVGTIAEMQRGMQRSDAGGKGGLDGVEALSGTLEGLTTTAKALAGERGKNSDGEETRRLRTRNKEDNKKRELVKWVLGAPSRLSAYVDNDERQRAQMEWQVVQKHLDRWQSVKGVSEIRTACEATMARVNDDEVEDKDD